MQIGIFSLQHFICPTSKDFIKCVLICSVGGPTCLTETLQWLKGYFEGQVTPSPDVCEVVINSKGEGFAKFKRNACTEYSLSITLESTAIYVMQ